MIDKQRIIVSLTSFPAAIPYAIQAIRSVLNGTLKPDKIVLYLDTKKFPNGKIPNELEDLKKRIQTSKSDLIQRRYVHIRNLFLRLETFLMM